MSLFYYFAPCKYIKEHTDAKEQKDANFSQTNITLFKKDLKKSKEASKIFLNRALTKICAAIFVVTTRYKAKFETIEKINENEMLFLRCKYDLLANFSKIASLYSYIFLIVQCKLNFYFAHIINKVQILLHKIQAHKIFPKLSDVKFSLKSLEIFTRGHFLIF